MSELVWYAAYGSNLDRDRFSCYLEGGTPRGGLWRYAGCGDQRAPRDSRPVRLPFPLFFAGASRTWGGGMAFLDQRRDDSWPTRGRAYLVTRDQLCGIFAQENRRRGLQLDLDRAVQDGRCTVGGGHYADLVRCRAEEGADVFTFTAPVDRLPDLAAPAPTYLRTVATGLADSHGLGREEIVEYLAKVPGIGLRYARADLRELLANVADHADPSSRHRSDAVRSGRVNPNRSPIVRR